MACSVCTCKGSITEEQWDGLDRIIGSHKDKRGSLIQCLHDAQELIGYLPMEVQKKVAEGLSIPLADVYSVVSFYALFNTQPKGEHEVSVCLGTACYVRGADAVLGEIQSELGVKPGETSSDGKYSLNIVRCMGACGLGPVVSIDGQTHGRLKADRIKPLLEKYN